MISSADGICVIVEGAAVPTEDEDDKLSIQLLLQAETTPGDCATSGVVWLLGVTGG